MEKERDQDQSNFSVGLNPWKMSEKKLENQLKNYDALNFIDSSRKLAATIIILMALFTVLLGSTTPTNYILPIFLSIFILLNHQAK